MLKEQNGGSTPPLHGHAWPPKPFSKPSIKSKSFQPCKPTISPTLPHSFHTHHTHHPSHLCLAMYGHSNSLKSYQPTLSPHAPHGHLSHHHTTHTCTSQLTHAARTSSQLTHGLHTITYNPHMHLIAHPCSPHLTTCLPMASTPPPCSLHLTLTTHPYNPHLTTCDYYSKSALL